VVTTGIRPVDLYVYLKSRFGEPNGHLMIVKNDDSDNLFHWHFAMATPLGTLEFICWTFRLEIFHPFNPVDSDAHEFLQCIKNDFQNHAQRMGEIRKSLEHWHMFLNPYRRLKSMIEDNLQEIVDLHIEDIVDPVHPTNLDDAESFKDQFSKAAEKYARASRLCLSVRMLAPVLAESFVNMIIFILARPEIKADKRLYESTVRQNIDVRIRSLHLNCEGFSTHVLYDDWEAFKEFHTLVNNRNKLLHGNIDPALTEFHDLFFEGKTPLFKEFKDFSFFSYKAELLNSTPEEALRDYQVVQDMCSHIMLCIQEDLREQVLQPMLARDLGWDPDRKRIGILFPDHMTDAFFD